MGAGLTWVIFAGPRETEKRVVMGLMDSVPVVTVTFRPPTVARGSMLTTAVKSVGEFTVNDAMLTPAPRFKVVTP